MADSKTRSKLHGVSIKHKLLSQEMDQDTVGIYKEYDMLPSVSVIQCRRTQVDTLFSHEDWSDGAQDPTAAYLDCSFEDTSLAESQEYPSLTKEAGGGGKPGDIEFEWQWIVHQERSAACWSSSFSEPSVHKEERMDEDWPSKECVSKYEMSLSGSHNEFAKAATGTVPSSAISPAPSVHMGPKNPKHGGNLCWRTANEEELVILISRVSREHLKNCDLPPPSNMVAMKRSLLADLDNTLRSADESEHANELILVSLLERYKPSSLERNSSPSSPLIVTVSDPTTCNEAFCIGCQPYSVPSSSLKTAIQEDRSGILSNVETLGEALCHAQTRARYAERAAAQALLDKEKVTQLLLTEAWTTRTYKHWIHAFELENLWFRRHFESHPECYIEQGPLFSPFLDKLVKNDCWRLHENPAHSTRKQWTLGGNLIMRYTLGLAFAIGLTFAGAGLMLGWRMGWITFAW